MKLRKNKDLSLSIILVWILPKYIDMELVFTPIFLKIEIRGKTLRR